MEETVHELGNVQQQSVQPSPSCLHPKQNRYGTSRKVQGDTEIKEDLNGDILYNSIISYGHRE